MLETAPQRRLLSVQALRGLAAFMVLVLHCAAQQRANLSTGAAEELARLTGFWDQGFAGVDLFFVISGFIMVYVTHGKPRSGKTVAKFLYSRASRIYPLWWFFAGLMVLYFIISYGVMAPPDRISGTEAVLPYTIKSFLLIQDRFLPVLFVGWTLIFEVYFYIAFALFLFLPRRFLPWLLAIWGGLIIAAWIFLPTPIHPRNIPELIISPLTLEFIAGAFLGLIITNRVFDRARLVTGLGIALLLGAVFIGSNYGINRVLLYTLPFAALIYGLSALEHKDKLSVPRWMVAMGDWSYSLYLGHMFVILTVRRVMMIAEPYLPAPLQFQADGAWDNLLFVVLTIPGAILVAALSYRFIETPLLQWTRKLSS